MKTNLQTLNDTPLRHGTWTVENEDISESKMSHILASCLEKKEFYLYPLKIICKQFM